MPETKTDEQKQIDKDAAIETTASTVIQRAEDGKPLVVKDHSELDALKLGKMLAATGYFPDSKTAAQCAVKVMAGQELGIPPIAAMTGIHIVKGKVMIGGTMMASLVDRHPSYRYEVTKMENTGVEVVFYKDGKKIGVSSFTIEDAERQGLGVVSLGSKMIDPPVVKRALRVVKLAEAVGGMP